MERFCRVCILSGCDYLPKGLPGVGLAKAVKFFAATDSNDLEQVSGDRAHLCTFVRSDAFATFRRPFET